MSELTQGTTAWKNWRKKGVGASEGAVVLGISPWSTIYQLWLSKTGRAQDDDKTNYAIEKGKRWEDAARKQYQWETDLLLPPSTLTDDEHPFIKASLDGYDKENGIVLEIKIPGKAVMLLAKEGQTDDEKTKQLIEEWKIADFCYGDGLVDPKYYVQCQQQLMVTKAKECHFYCCDVQKDEYYNERIVDTALVIVKPDLEFQKMLRMKLVEFWQFVQQDIAPPLSPKDTLFLEDFESVNLFTRIKKAKEAQRRAEFAMQKALEHVGEAEAQLADLKEEAIEYLDSFEQRHNKYRCQGILMYRDKNDVWVIRLDKDEHSPETQTSANTTM